MNVLVTGANRGIGLGFVQHYLSLGWQVWACYRRDCDGLRKIDNPRLQLLRWDVTQPAPSHGAELLPERLDVLINNAGIYGPKQEAAQNLAAVSMLTMHEVFDVDCLGALRVVQYLLPRLKQAGTVIANISSKMGSSADNSSGGCYAYRAAKCALVIISKSMAIDLASYGVQVITLHPGWVRTAMTEQSGLIDVDESVKGLAEVIAKAEHYAPGQFIAFDGQLIPY